MPEQQRGPFDVRVVKQGENYFTVLHDECQRLDQLAAPLLEDRPEWSMEDLGEKQWAAFVVWWNKLGHDASKLPECVRERESIQRYLKPPHNGSLLYAMGWSIMAMEACAWAWYDYLVAQKDEPFQPPLPCLVKVEVEPDPVPEQKRKKRGPSHGRPKMLSTPVRETA